MTSAAGNTLFRRRLQGISEYAAMPAALNVTPIIRDQLGNRTQ